MIDTSTITGYNELCPWQLANVKLMNQANDLIGYEKYVILSFNYNDLKLNHETTVITHMRRGPTAALEPLLIHIPGINCEQLNLYLAGVIDALRDHVVSDKK